MHIFKSSRNGTLLVALLPPPEIRPPRSAPLTQMTKEQFVSVLPHANLLRGEVATEYLLYLIFWQISSKSRKLSRACKIVIRNSHA